MSSIYCACCGRSFKRKNQKGAKPKYCSDACRRQMAVRRGAWAQDWSKPSSRYPQSEPEPPPPASSPYPYPPRHSPPMSGDD